MIKMDNMNNKNVERKNGAFYITIPIHKYVYTAGNSRWSDNAHKKIYIQKFVFVVEEEKDVDGERYCSLDVFFSRLSWVISRDGLIYTDTGFLHYIKELLIDIGVPKDIASRVRYSEQGMQGTNRVNFDTFDLGDFMYEKFTWYGLTVYDSRYLFQRTLLGVRGAWCLSHAAVCK